MANNSNNVSEVLIHQNGYLAMLGNDLMKNQNAINGSHLRLKDKFSFNKEKLINDFARNCFTFTGALIIYSLVGSVFF